MIAADYILHFAIASTVLIVVELVLYFWRAQELKNAKMVLRRAKREVFETAQISLGNPYPLIQISDKGEIIFINPAAYERFSDLYELGLKHPILSGIESIMMSNNRISRDVEVGDLVYNQMILPGQLNGEAVVTIYCYDVTERKIYEKKLQESQWEAEKLRLAAERANQARGDFLANMSHELRTPMNAIVGLSDILVESDLNPEHQRLIEAMNASAHNLMTMLNDILDFSKIEAGELSLEKIPFDLRKMVQQIEALQKPIAERKGLAMKSEINDAVPRYLIGDACRLQQILNNLIGNALKFTEEGSVTLSVTGDKSEEGSFLARFAVTDTGIGIPREQQKNLFKKFQQADSSTARKFGGTGLGLAISKNIAELMGGNISLYSEEGKGTTFTVIIPIEIAAPEVMEKEKEDAKEVQGRFNENAKIMVVDDHSINLLFMQKALIKLGLHNFDEATTGSQAVELFKKGHYDLILMDCQMPDIDGYEASRQIRRLESSGSRVAIIAVTASALKGAEEKCKASGMNDYISKPVNKDKLAAALFRWIPAPGVFPIVTDMKTDEMKERPDSSSVFDWNHLYEYTNGDRDTEVMLINMFIESLNVDLINLQKNFHDQNIDGWEAVAHKLHGASAHMGAYALANICEQAETLDGEIEKMKEFHQLILAESQRLHMVLEKSNGALIQSSQY